MSSQNPNNKWGLFTWLLLLTACLILAEISFLIQCSSAYLGDFKYVTDHLAVPLSIVPGVLGFIAIQLAIHLVFLILIWAVARLVGRALHWSEKYIERSGIILWFFAVVTALIANRVFYPNSKFSTVLLGSVTLATAKIIFALLICFWLPVVLLALAGSFIRTNKKSIWTLPGIYFSFIVAAFTTVMLLPSAAPPTDGATAEKPNIIIIGIDSLRPDFLGFFGYAQHTPHIDNFLNHSTVFAEALTPLARTYPSWVSILTGIYPKLNTVRTNLADQSQLDLSEILPALLRAEGYETIFATDETRFSNIDTRYGFDKTITPPIGFKDFLLGTANDFPLSNLLLNTTIGRYLFPNSYANRAVFATYKPNSFLHLLQPTLEQSRTKPTLLIAHLCLPHYPYAWADLPAKKISLHHYQAAVHRADQQFHDLMLMLQQNNFLQHSMVILLSDHGEAVEIPGDRITDPALFIAGDNNPHKTIPHFYPPSAAKEQVDMSGGHGTDVLGLSQYHTVLAFKTFGMKKNQLKTVSGLVSLMDIKPTVLMLLNIPLGRSSGEPLLDYIFNDKNTVKNTRDFFLESDFSPEAIRTIHPEERKVLLEGINYFRIDPKTERLVVRDSMWQMILSSKQYADFYGKWVLALYPRNSKPMQPILVNLATGGWTDDLQTEFAKNSPAQHMLKAMKIFYGKDVQLK